TYVSVDGGMSDNLRTALYGAEYTAVLASRSSDASPMLSRLVGKHCESGDIVVRDVWFPEDLAAGDLVAVAATGAYCRSMASNYTLVPKPVVVAVRDARSCGITGGERADCLLRLEAQGEEWTPAGALRASLSVRSARRWSGCGGWTPATWPRRSGCRW